MWWLVVLLVVEVAGRAAKRRHDETWSTVALVRVVKGGDVMSMWVMHAV